MKLILSQPVRRLLLLLVFGVAPVVVYLGFLRPQTQAEYFLRENLRDLEILSQQISALCNGYLQAIKVAGEHGCYSHLKGVTRPSHSGKPRAADSRCQEGTAKCEARLDVVKAAAELPMSTELSHSFDAPDAPGVTKQTSDLVFSASCDQPSGGERITEASLQVELKEAIPKLLRGSELAEYDLFLADKDGTVSFDYGQRGRRLLQFGDQAPPTEAPKDESGKAKPEKAANLGNGAVLKLGDLRLGAMTRQTMTTEVDAAGRRFQLLTVPFEVSTKQNGSGEAGTESATWVVGLLVPSDHLSEKATKLSYGSWSLLPLAILAALLSIPIVKVRSIGPRQPFGHRDVAWLVASLLLVPMIVATLLVALVTHATWEGDMDRQLRGISARIQTNLMDEINSVAGAVDTFIDCRARPRALDLSAANRSPADFEECVCYDGCDESAKGSSCHGQDCTLKSLVTKHPFLDFVLWADTEGVQREKWSVEATATPLINMRRFHPFYADLLNERAGRTIHTQVSPTTGERITILSKPIVPSASAQAADSPRTLGIAAAVFSPLSVVNPVLPPGFGYAVVEDRGQVVFHTISRRSLYENFLEETDGAEAISSLVQGGGSGFVTANYHGRAHRLYVHPLGTMPWSLIVFRDKEILRVARLDIMLTWGFGILLLVAAWMFIRGLVRLTLGRTEVLWYWPDSRLAHIYVQICAVVSLWFIVMTWLLLSPPAAAPLLTLATVIAPGPLLASFVFLRLTRMRPESNRGALRRCRWLARLIFAAAAIGFVSAALTGLTASLSGGVGDLAARLSILTLIILTLAGLLPRLDEVGPTWSPWHQSYIACGLVLIVVTSVLPSLILYRDAVDSGMAVFTRHGQLKLAQRLASRYQTIHRRYDVAAKASEETTSDVSWQLALAAKGMFWDGTIAIESAKKRGDHECDLGAADGDGTDASLSWPSEWFGCPLAGDRNLVNGHFTSAILACLPVYNPESVELRSLAYSEATRPRDADCNAIPLWEASIDPEGCSVMLASDPRIKEPGKRHDEMRVLKSAPILSLPLPSGWIGWGLLATATLSLAGLLIATVSPVAHRIFAFRLKPNPNPTAGSPPQTPKETWATFSDAQKSVLYHLATTSFVTPHPVAWRIIRRLTGTLVVLNPEPKFADDEFREFVADTSTEAEVQAWETGGPGNWDQIRSVAQATAILVGIGLYFTQAEAVTQWSGALTAATGLAGSLVAALGALRGSEKGKT